MIDWLQRDIYEALDFLGPLNSALLAGFATITWEGEIHITPAGERYIDTVIKEQLA